MIYGRVGTYGITDELIVWLKATFPNRLPSGKGATIEDLRFLQGQQKVIEIIESEFNISNQNNDTSETSINISSKE